jgi:glutamate/aspartate transport system substrate-binding protein
MLRLFREGQIELLYKKWFQSPIPPKGVSIGLAPSYLFRELIRYPGKSYPATDMIWM